VGWHITKPKSTIYCRPLAPYWAGFFAFGQRLQSAIWITFATFARSKTDIKAKDRYAALQHRNKPKWPFKPL